jgi:hypothetical protein
MIAELTQISSFNAFTTRIRLGLKHDRYRKVSQLYNGYSHSLIR